MYRHENSLLNGDIIIELVSFHEPLENLKEEASMQVLGNDLVYCVVIWNWDFHELLWNFAFKLLPHTKQNEILFLLVIEIHIFIENHLCLFKSLHFPTEFWHTVGRFIGLVKNLNNSLIDNLSHRLFLWGLLIVLRVNQVGKVQFFLLILTCSQNYFINFG